MDADAAGEDAVLMTRAIASSSSCTPSPVRALVEKTPSTRRSASVEVDADDAEEEEDEEEECEDAGERNASMSK